MAQGGRDELGGRGGKGHGAPGGERLAAAFLHAHREAGGEDAAFGVDVAAGVVLDVRLEDAGIGHARNLDGEGHAPGLVGREVRERDGVCGERGLRAGDGPGGGAGDETPVGAFARQGGDRVRLHHELRAHRESLVVAADIQRLGRGPVVRAAELHGKFGVVLGILAAESPDRLPGAAHGAQVGTQHAQTAPLHAKRGTEDGPSAERDVGHRAAAVKGEDAGDASVGGREGFAALRRGGRSEGDRRLQEDAEKGELF